MKKGNRTLVRIMVCIVVTLICVNAMAYKSPYSGENGARGFGEIFITEQDSSTGKTTGEYVETEGVVTIYFEVLEGDVLPGSNGTVRHTDIRFFDSDGYVFMVQRAGDSYMDETWNQEDEIETEAEQANEIVIENRIKHRFSKSAKR